MVFDSKMLVKMIFVMMSLNILIRTILTFVQFIVVDTHMLLQIILNFKSWLTIWFQAFVPKICFVSHRVNLSMMTQILLKFWIERCRRVKWGVFFTFDFCFGLYSRPFREVCVLVFCGKKRQVNIAAVTDSRTCSWKWMTVKKPQVKKKKAAATSRFFAVSNFFISQEKWEWSWAVCAICLLMGREFWQKRSL